MPFADRRHAQHVADQWNDDHAEQMEVMRADGWSEGKVARRGVVGPEEREQWTGGGSVWTRMPDRQLVHRRTAFFRPDGQLDHEPHPMTSRWAWEFESDAYTDKAAETRTEFRPGATALTGGHARGIDKAAVIAAFEGACMKAQEICSQSP